MYLIVNETIRSVHLASSLPVGASECILALKRGAADRVADIPVHTGRCVLLVQACKPSKLTGINLAGDVGSHVNSRVICLGYIVVSYWQSAGLGCDLDVFAVDGFRGYL